MDLAEALATLDEAPMSDLYGTVLVTTTGGAGSNQPCWWCFVWPGNWQAFRIENLAKCDVFTGSGVLRWGGVALKRGFEDGLTMLETTREISDDPHLKPQY